MFARSLALAATASLALSAGAIGSAAAQSPAVPTDLTQRVGNFGTLMGAALRCGRAMSDAAALSQSVYDMIDEEITANIDRQALRDAYMVNATQAYRSGTTSAGGPDCVPIWLEFDLTLERMTQ